MALYGGVLLLSCAFARDLRSKVLLGSRETHLKGILDSGDPLRAPLFKGSFKGSYKGSR